DAGSARDDERAAVGLRAEHALDQRLGVGRQRTAAEDAEHAAQAQRLERGLAQRGRPGGDGGGGGRPGRRDGGGARALPRRRAHRAPPSATSNSAAIPTSPAAQPKTST